MCWRQIIDLERELKMAICNFITSMDEKNNVSWCTRNMRKLCQFTGGCDILLAVIRTSLTLFLHWESVER